MLRNVHRVVLASGLFLLVEHASHAANPAQWTIVEELQRTDTTKTWVSPTAVDLGKMVWEFDYEIAKVTGTVSLGVFGNVTQDITDSIPADQRIGSGETHSLPAVLLDDAIVEPESGTSADVYVEVDPLGFGRAVFSNIMLGSVNVPLFGSRPIQRINLEASVSIVGYDFGDYNRDHRVDAADYVVWRQLEGQEGDALAADGNGDDRVDAMDYTVWRANFVQGDGTPALASTAVPEPASWMIVFPALPAFYGRGRRQILLHSIGTKG